MDDLERALIGLFAGGNRQVAPEALLRLASVCLQHEMAGSGP